METRRKCPTCNATLSSKAKICSSCYTELRVVEFDFTVEYQEGGRVSGHKAVVDGKGKKEEKPVNRQEGSEFHSIRCFFKCYQQVLMTQIDYLINVKQCSPMIKTYAGEIWFNYLALINIDPKYSVEQVVESMKKMKSETSEAMKVIKSHLKKRKQAPGVKTAKKHLDIERELSALNNEDENATVIDSILNSDETEGDLRENQNVPRVYPLSYSMAAFQSRLEIDEQNYETYFLWSMLPTPSDTLIFCYLACMRARESIMLCDLRRWAMEGSFPYRYVLAELEKNEKWKKSAQRTMYFKKLYKLYDMNRSFVRYSYYKIFGENRIPSTAVLWRKLISMFNSGLSMSNISVHCETIVDTLCEKYLCLCADNPLRSEITEYTCNLISLLSHSENEGRSASIPLIVGSDGSHTSPFPEYPPEVIVSLFMLVALKLRFGLSENEALTDPEWIRMIETMLFKWNERNLNLVSNVLGKQIPSNLSDAITKQELLQMVSAGTFEKFLTGETIPMSNTFYHRSIRSSRLRIEESIANDLLHEQPRQLPGSENNRFTAFLQDKDQLHEAESNNRHDTVLDKIIYYYAKRYVVYNSKHHTSEDPRFHAQFSFILESLEQFHNMKIAHKSLRRIEKSLLTVGGVSFRKTSLL